MALEIAKMLVLSTAHIKQSTASEFECNTDDVPPFFDKHPYGWFIPIVEGQAWPHTCPDDLLAIRRLAEENGCNWIMLDRDADLLHGHGLEIYRW